MHVPSIIFAAIAVAGFAFSVPRVKAAGFDCREARSQIERLICADPDLSRLDEELAQDFEAIRRETAGRDGETGQPSLPFGEDHARWREAVRDQCRDSACLKAAYEARLAKVRQDWSEVLRGR